MRRLSMGASGDLANVACVTRGWHLLRCTAQLEAKIRNRYSDSEWTVAQASSFLYPWRVYTTCHKPLTGEVKMFSLFRRRRRRTTAEGSYINVTMSGNKPIRTVPPRPAQVRTGSTGMSSAMPYVDPAIVDPLSPVNPFSVFNPAMYDAPGGSTPDPTGGDIAPVAEGQEYAPLDSTPSAPDAPSPSPDPSPSSSDFDSGGSSYDSGSSPSYDSSPSFDSGGSSFDSGSSGGGDF